MKLKKFLSKKGLLKELADHLDLSPAYVWQIANNLRPCPVRYCLAIEKFSGGLVARKELRPKDWHLIWSDAANEVSNNTQKSAA